MVTFGQRLHAAMLAAGKLSTADVAKSCGISRQTVATWLKQDEPQLSAVTLVKVCNCLRVRMRWLAEGRGPMPLWAPHREAQMRRAHVVLEALAPEQAELWLSAGEKLIPK